MRFFALNGTAQLGLAVSENLGIGLAPHEEREFEGGEHKTRPLVSVQGEEVFVLHSLNGNQAGSANDKLARLLFFIAACRDHGAEKVTAIVPYLAYSRKDRQTKEHDPVNSRYVAQLFEAIGTDRVVTVDVHNPAAFQNGFRCPTFNLSSAKMFSGHFAREKSGRPQCIVSPDPGGVKRAQLFREALEQATGQPTGFAFLEKRRSGGVITGDLFAGEVDGCDVIIIDDMIVSGSTMARAARACRERGAASVHLAASHGLFMPGVEALAEAPIDSITVTDSVELAFEPKWAKIRFIRLTIAPLIAGMVRRIAARSPDDRITNDGGNRRD